MKDSTTTREMILLDKPEVLGNTISKIPAGTKVKVDSKTMINGYYKSEYLGKIGYLSEFAFIPVSARSSTKQVASMSEENNVQKNESSNEHLGKDKMVLKTYYKDGATIQYYLCNGI